MGSDRGGERGRLRVTCTPPSSRDRRVSFTCGSDENGWADRTGGRRCARIRAQCRGLEGGGPLTISSRTPDGERQHCAACASVVRVQPSTPPGDATCPVCGALLWTEDHKRSEASARDSDLDDDRFVRRALASMLEVDLEELPRELDVTTVGELGVDPLDLIERLLAEDEQSGA